MATISNLLPEKLNPSTGEYLAPRLVTKWRDGVTDMTDALCGGLYSKDNEASSPTIGQYFKWNAAGYWPVSRLKEVNQSNFQKLINDFGDDFVTILLDRTVSLSDDLTVPFNITIKFQQGAIFIIDADAKLTIESAINEADFQLFSVTGGLKLATKTLYPEWFGAVRDGIVNCSPALQRCFNYSETNAGSQVKLGVGAYLLASTVTIKSIQGAADFKYNVDVIGSGISLTVLKGAETFSGNLIEMKSGQQNFSGRENYISIRDMQIAARGADRCLYGNYLAGLNLTDISFLGGEIECVKFGSTTEVTLNYSMYLTRCRFLGATKNGGNSQGHINATNCLFLYINGMEGDGGKYGIYLNNCADSTIIGSKIEGYKKAAIYIESSNGGQYHKIEGNYLAAYAGFDVNAVFDGTMYGLLLKGTYPFGCTILGNTFRVAETSELPLVMTYTTISNVQVSSEADTITGTQSGAIGYLQAVKSSNSTILVKMISGTFVPGESFTHRRNNVIQGSGVIGTIGSNSTYTIKLEGAYGSNTIIGNSFASQTDYGIHSTSQANRIEGNGITGKVGVYINKNGTVSGNTFYCDNTPWINDGELATFYGNTITSGTQTGVQNNFLNAVSVKGGLSTDDLSVTEDASFEKDILLGLSKIIPEDTDVVEIGQLAKAIKFIVSSTVRSTIIRAINNGVVLQNSEGAQGLRLFNEDASVVIGPSGVTRDPLRRLQVVGDTKFKGDITWEDAPIATNNQNALDYGALVNDIYKTPTGEIRIVV